MEPHCGRALHSSQSCMRIEGSSHPGKIKFSLWGKLVSVAGQVSIQYSVSLINSKNSKKITLPKIDMHKVYANCLSSCLSGLSSTIATVVFVSNKDKF